MEATVIFQLRDDAGGTRGVDRWRGRGAPGIWLRSKCGSGRLWLWEGESGVKAKQVAAGKARTRPLLSQPHALFQNVKGGAWRDSISFLFHM